MNLSTTAILETEATALDKSQYKHGLSAKESARYREVAVTVLQFCCFNYEAFFEVRARVKKRLKLISQ